MAFGNKRGSDSPYFVHEKLPKDDGADYTRFWYAGPFLLLQHRPWSSTLEIIDVARNRVEGPSD